MKRVACLSQKGGVGKSTFARELAVMASKAHWKVCIADMDTGQSTSKAWSERRKHFGAGDDVTVIPCPTEQDAINITGYNLVIFDGKPFANRQTLALAKVSDLILIPATTAMDEIEPQVKLAHELYASGVPKEAILFVLNRSLLSPDRAEVQAVRDYITSAGYTSAATIVPARQGYVKALNEGRSLSEVTFPSLKAAADGIGIEIYRRLMREV